MVSKDIVTEKSISFLQSIFDSTKRYPRHAHPISTLPYPKEKIKEVLKKHILSLGKENWDNSLERSIKLCIIKSLYLSLADFIDDKDSRFLNNIWDVENDNDRFKNPQEQARYEAVTDAQEKEREEMSAEINVAAPTLCSINLLSVA